MIQKLSFLGIFLITAGGTIFNNNDNPWVVGLVLFTAPIWLMTATFLGWVRLPIFEMFTTVPLIRVVVFFSAQPEPAHILYLETWKTRRGQ